MEDYIEDRGMKNGRGSSGLSVAGMVIGMVSLVISFIPCIGTLALIPAIVGLVLAILGYRKDSENNISTTMSIVGIILTSLAILLSAAQSFFLGSVGNSVSENLEVEATTCDEILVQLELVINEISSFKEKDENEMDFSLIKKMVNLTTKVAAYSKKANDMGCNEDPEFKEKMDKITEKIED